MPNQCLKINACAVKKMGEFNNNQRGNKRGLPIRRATNRCSHSPMTCSPENFRLPFHPVGHEGNGSRGSIRPHPVTKTSLLFSALILSSMAMRASGMENGISREGNPAAENFSSLLIKTKLNGERINTCSSMKISATQVITAKHCVKALTQLRASGLIPQTIKVHPHVDMDIAILTYPSPLPGNQCPPKMMSAAGYAALKATPKWMRPCGLKGNVIMLARGNESDDYTNYLGKLKAGLFDYEEEPIKRKNHETMVVGVGTPKAKTKPGDSGGPVLGCNPITRRFECLGIFVKGQSRKMTRDGPLIRGFGSLFANIAKNQQAQKWVKDNTEPCVGAEVDITQVFPSQDHLVEVLPDSSTCVSLESRDVGNKKHLKVKNDCLHGVQVYLKEKQKRSIKFTVGSKRSRTQVVDNSDNRVYTTYVTDH